MKFNNYFFFIITLHYKMSLKSDAIVHAEAYTPDMKDDGFWLEEKPFKITVIREIIHIANFNGARLYEAKITEEDIMKKNMPHDIDLAAKLMTDILLNQVKNSLFNLAYGECGVKIDFELRMEYSKFDFEFYLQEKGGEMDRMGRQIELLKDQSFKLHKEVHRLEGDPFEFHLQEKGGEMDRMGQEIELLKDQSLKLHKEVKRLEGDKLMDIADNMSLWFTLQFIRHTIPEKFGDIMKPDGTAKFSRDIIGTYRGLMQHMIQVRPISNGQPFSTTFNTPFVCGTVFPTHSTATMTCFKIKALKLFVANHYYDHCDSVPLHYNVLDECEVTSNYKNGPWISLREHIKESLKIE